MSATSAAARRAEALGARLPPLLVAAKRVAATVASGVHGRRRVGQGDAFWEYRPLLPGESPRAGRPAGLGEGGAVLRARDRVGGGADGAALA